MTPKLNQTVAEAEFDRLTYSAYLLTSDPDLALSAVLIDCSVDEI